jgi:hypothetical protein
MNPARGLAGDDADRDPYFHAADVGPDKAAGLHGDDSPRRRRQFRRRTSILVVVLAVVWMGVLLDQNIGPMVLMMLAAFGLALGLMGTAMVLGILGFGLCAAGGRAWGRLRRAARWPDE